MSEESLREKLATIDEKRARAGLLLRMAEWPMFAPSKVTADKKRGLFRRFGMRDDKPFDEMTLTREERSELCDWLRAKSTQLDAEADELAETLEDFS